MSGGLTTAWLTNPPFFKVPPMPTLKVSADEQLGFLNSLWLGQLKATPRAVELTKKVTFLETSPKGVTLNGKTGSGWLGVDKLRLGWFISHIEGIGKEYTAVVSLTEKKRRKSYNSYAGYEAKKILKDFLADNGLW